MPDVFDIVDISITVETAGATAPGFGIPLILSSNAGWVERIRFYSNLPGVAVDFASTTPEYKAAAAMFAQTPGPALVAIGRLANKPTQRWAIRISSVLNLTAYRVRVGANTATFTSDASATNDEIVAGLVAAINALSGDTLTATADTSGGAGFHFVRLTGNAAGTWDDVEIAIADTVLMEITQDHVDPGVAADLTAISNEDNSWYAIYNPWNSTPMALAIAAWAETAKKLFLLDTQETDCATVTSGSDSTSVMAQVKTAAYEYSPTVYHTSNGSFIGAAWLGRCLPFEPGSETWALKTLAGVAAVKLTDTHITNLKAKNGNYYITIAEKNVTLNGVTSGTRKYIDVLRFIDWAQADMGIEVFNALTAVAKVPFTQQGVSIVEGKMYRSLSKGVRVRGWAPTPPPKVFVPKVEDIAAADKNNRLLPDLFFDATLGGAVHGVKIRGRVSV